MLDKVPFTHDDMTPSNQQMKFDRGCAEVGMVAELVHFFMSASPDGSTPRAAPMLSCVAFYNLTEKLYNHVLQSGNVRGTWSRTLHYDVACVVESHRFHRRFLPTWFQQGLRTRWTVRSLQEQHSFRKQPRIEQHLNTARYVVDRTEAANLPVWRVSLDLGKSFYWIDWDMLGEVLAEQGVSAHSCWIIFACIVINKVK